MSIFYDVFALPAGNFYLGAVPDPAPSQGGGGRSPWLDIMIARNAQRARLYHRTNLHRLDKLVRHLVFHQAEAAG